jgi:leucyl/phenylalanyl-tRNA--protein transferase
VRTLLDLPRLAADPDSPFPATSLALRSPDGLLAWGGGLEPARLLNAYARGIFPWYSKGQPLLWWSPAPRCVIHPDRVYLSRRTARRHNSGQFTLTADRAFERVIGHCAEPRRDDAGTWITDEMRRAYVELHRMNHAHSIEVWRGSELVGGIYGVALGRVFFGESMFSRRADASKVALVALCHELLNRSIDLLDCQVSNPHLLRMGAVEISRETFESFLGDGTIPDPPAESWSAGFHPRPHWVPGPVVE